MTVPAPKAVAAVLVAALALGLPAPAFAQINNKALAEQAFQEGRDAMKRNALREACEAFARSQALEARLGTLLNLATCNEQIGRTATAWGQFVEAIDVAGKEGDKREAFAKEHAGALVSRLSHVEITRAGATPGFELSIDDRKVGLVLIGTPLPLDPGKHVFLASAPGHKAWRVEVDVPIGPSRTTINIPALAPEAGAAAPVAPLPGFAPAPIAPPLGSEPAPSRGVHPLVWVGVGVGGLGLVVGSISGAVSLSKTGSLKDACHDDACPPDKTGSISSANTTATISNIGFIAFAVGAATAGITLLATSSSSPKPTAALVVKRGGVTVEPTGDGLRLTF